jgi:hypothetical protein
MSTPVTAPLPSSTWGAKRGLSCRITGAASSASLLRSLASSDSTEAFSEKPPPVRFFTSALVSLRHSEPERCSEYKIWFTIDCAMVMPTW